jgi:hypothetical protein
MLKMTYSAQFHLSRRGWPILFGVAAAAALLPFSAQEAGAASSSGVTFNAQTGICRGGTPGTSSEVVCPNPPNTNQTRPVQLGATGNPIPQRDFIYFGLSPAAISGLFTGVTGWQWGPADPSPSPNSQRFSYSGGISSSSTIPFENVALDFRPFYLTGDCSICGSINSVARTNLVGSALRVDLNPGSSNALSSNIVPIVFGRSGITGTLNFTAFTNVASGVQTSGGQIFLTAVENGGTAVPGPLPVLGAGTAFGFSRRLRKRIKPRVELG